MPPRNKKKQPFSNKQKKIQLQQKREKKKGKGKKLNKIL